MSVRKIRICTLKCCDISDIYDDYIVFLIERWDSYRIEEVWVLCVLLNLKLLQQFYAEFQDWSNALRSYRKDCKCLHALHGALEGNHWFLCGTVNHYFCCSKFSVYVRSSPHTCVLCVFGLYGFSSLATGHFTFYAYMHWLQCEGGISLPFHCISDQLSSRKV